MIVYMSAMDNDTSDKDFDYFYYKYKNMVWSIICKFIKDEFYREDLMQEIFIKFFKTLGHFQNESAVKRWLAIVAKSTITDGARKEKTYKKHFEFRIDDEDLMESIVDFTSDFPYDSVMKKEASSEISRAVRALKPIYYEVIVLNFFMEFTPKEIARLTHKSINTIYSRLHKAEAILYDTLDDSIKEQFIRRGDNNAKPTNK